MTYLGLQVIGANKRKGREEVLEYWSHWEVFYSSGFFSVQSGSNASIYAENVKNNYLHK